MIKYLIIIVSLLGIVIAIWVLLGSKSIALEFVQKQLDLREVALKEARQQHVEAVEQIAHLEAVNKHLSEQVATQEKRSKEQEEKLLLQFKNLSNELLDAKGRKFTEQNQKELDKLLLPLREKIGDFQQQLVHSRQDSIKGTMALKQEFDKVHGLYERIRSDTEKATRALMGDNKLQGTWGEVNALGILEQTGLRKNEQYFVQKGFATKSGDRLIPDITIKLPGKRNIIMDVKVSLVNYVKYFNTEDPEEKKKFLKQHIASIKNHIKLLSKKNYAQLYDLEGLDCVLLLLSVEPAFSLALQHEPSLFEEAYQQNIVLVSPATLRATLSIIENVWQGAYRNRYALEIAKQSGDLYDKFVNFVESLKKIGHHLSLGTKAYDQALKKLATGKGNLVSRAEKIKKMGARTSKILTLPNEDLLLEQLEKPQE